VRSLFDLHFIDCVSGKDADSLRGLASRSFLDLPNRHLVGQRTSVLRSSIVKGTISFG
jgi:hypothetical protein